MQVRLVARLQLAGVLVAAGRRRAWQTAIHESELSAESDERKALNQRQHLAMVGGAVRVKTGAARWLSDRTGGSARLRSGGVARGCGISVRSVARKREECLPESLTGAYCLPIPAHLRRWRGRGPTRDGRSPAWFPSSGRIWRLPATWRPRARCGSRATSRA